MDGQGSMRCIRCLPIVAANATFNKSIQSTLLMNPIYRITYQRPWGECVVNTTQFATEDDLRARFAQSYKGCELLKVEDVTDYFLPKIK